MRDIGILGSGLLICWLTNGVMDVVLPTFSISILFGYTNLLAAGIFITLVVKKQRIMKSAFLGATYAFTEYLYALVFVADFNVLSARLALRLINSAVLYGLIIAGTCTILYHIAGRVKTGDLV